MNWLWFLLAGLCAGVLSGMGMGGGTVLIPLLTLFLQVEQHAAQGINMLAFLPGAIVALIVHKKDGRLEAKKCMPLLYWGIAGAIGGAFIATALKAVLLQKAFGVFLVVLALVQWRKAGKHKGVEKSTE